MNNKSSNHIDNRKKRHDRYFKKLVIIVGILLIGVLGYKAIMSYHQKMEKVAAIAAKIEKSQLGIDLFQTISVFKGADMDIKEDVIDYYGKKVYQFPAPMIFAVADYYYQEEEYNEAQFWLFWGRFVLRFDAYRCRDHEDIKAWLDYYDERYALVLEKKLNAIKTSSPHYLNEEQNLERFLQAEAEHKFGRLPIYFCQMLEQPKQVIPRFTPRAEWQTIRRALRESLVQYLQNYNHFQEQEAVEKQRLETEFETVPSPAE